MKNLEETFIYDNQNRFTEVWLGTTQTGEFVYDGYGRITAKTADGQVLFFQAEYNTIDKPHAMVTASTPMGVFPSTKQTITYTGFDKVSKIKQGADSLCFTYGYDRQRILMDELVDNKHRTKRYVGNCEYIMETNGNVTDTQWQTYLTGPTGVFAVVMTKSGTDQIFYVLKDNLGSWTTITDDCGNVEQQLSYDAWGSLRDPNTWSGNFTGVPLFDRGFTGHEHLTAFGLINMNGRMYDPKMSSFLSADRYVSNPLTTQGFNRYAYCLNNPLRYTDPSGWLPGGAPDGPLRRVVIGGETTFILPEVVVLGDNPSLANYNTYEEFWYTPNLTGGGRNLQGNNVDPSTSIGPRGGTGGGSHGCGKKIQNNNLNNRDNITLDNNTTNGELAQINVTCFYFNSSNTIIGQSAELASSLFMGSKEVEAAALLGKISKGSKLLGIVGVGINLGCTTYQMYFGEIPKHEGFVRMGMTGVEFGLAFIPYVGPLLSIGLTAYDIGGGFDDNLYKTENWWKEKQP